MGTSTFTPERAREQAKALNDARDRLKDADGEAAAVGPPQLSFDLGAGHSGSPDFATLKISGALNIERDLKYMEHVHVTVTDRHGEVLSEAAASVTYPAFKDHFDKHGGKTVERQHTAQVD